MGRVLLGKLIMAHIVKEFVFSGMRSFITVFTAPHQWTIYWAR
jgi:hypothetical protein